MVALVTLAEIRSEAEKAIDTLADFAVRDIDACKRVSIDLLGDASQVGVYERIVETDKALPELEDEAIAARDGALEPGDTPAILTLGEIANEVLKVGNTVRDKPNNRAKRSDMARYLEDFIRDIDATAAACPEWDEYIRESDSPDGDPLRTAFGPRSQWSESDKKTHREVKEEAKAIHHAIVGEETA